jgi:hypothetical protein
LALAEVSIIHEVAWDRVIIEPSVLEIEIPSIVPVYSEV